MPPISTSKEFLLKRWIESLNSPDGVYNINAKKIFCQACQKEAPSDMKQHLKQHNETAAHVGNLHRFLNSNAKKQKTFLKTTGLDNFSLDLCKALVKSGIPIYKLAKPAFKEFLEKYTGKNRQMYLICQYASDNE